MNFGGDSVDVGKRSAGTRGQWNLPETEPVGWTPISGVRFRPLSTTEVIELYQKAIEVWRLTAPPAEAVMALTANDLVRHNGVVYEIDGGIEPYTDASGVPFKVTILCKRQQVATA